MEESQNEQNILIKQKEELLKSEIIDKNLDKEKFILLCLSRKKEGGDDINNWSLEELQSIIKEFQEMQRKQDENLNLANEKIQSDIEQIDIQNMQHIGENIHQKSGPNPNNNTYNNSSNAGQTQNKPQKSLKDIEIQCKKIQKTMINDKAIKVIIKNPKPIETTFFKTNYVAYEVETKCMSWNVYRRYSDFEWLRNVLVKFNPGYFIPPLPGKKLGSGRFDIAFITERMKFLQIFIDEVTSNELFKSSEGLVSFLSMTDQKQFESKMKELSSTQLSNYLEERRTFNGSVIIADPEDTDSEKYFVNITNYFRIQTQLFERLTNNLDDYYKNISNACLSLKEVQRDFATLHLLNVRVLMKDQITKSFEQFGIFFKNWERVLAKQNDVMKYNVKDFFKLMEYNCNAYNELVEKRNAIKKTYTSERDELIKKKEKLWNSGDPNKWEITEDFTKIDLASLKLDRNYAFSKMCTKDNSRMKLLWNTLGYYNKQNMEELKKLIKNNCKKYIENMKNFSNEFYPTLTDSLNVYTSLQIFVTSI